MKALAIALSLAWLAACQTPPSQGEGWQATYQAALGAYQSADYTMASALATRALSEAAVQEGQDSLATASVLSLLGASLLADAEFSEAQRNFEQAIAILESATDVEPSSLANAYNNLAEAYRQQGRDGEALPLYAQALELVERAYGPSHEETGRAAAALASMSSPLLSPSSSPVAAHAPTAISARVRGSHASAAAADGSCTTSSSAPCFIEYRFRYVW